MKSQRKHVSQIKARKFTDVSDSLCDEILASINQLQDSIVIFDKKWRYVYLNEIGWKTLGRKKEEVLGQNVWKLLPHLKNTAFQKSAYRAMRKKERLEIEEYYPHRREWYRTIFYPSKNSMLIQIYDITALKNAERINEDLFGTLDQAMQTYWSDANKQRRESAKIRFRNN